jgi:pyridoxal phosphate enzyme (YggS family)
MSEPDLEALRSRIRAVRDRIAEACAASGRDPAEVTLVAVTKGHPLGAVELAARAGLEDLGENYVQELEAKREAAPAARWHYLGRVQANKASRIAAAAGVVHGLEPGHGARRLGRAALERGTAVRAFLEVDFTGARQGVAPSGVPRALEELRALPGIDLAGLMTVAPDAGPEATRRAFAGLRELRDSHAPDLRELSMGMSGDFPVAVEEGGTIARIGTALFGARPATAGTALDVKEI